MAAKAFCEFEIKLSEMIVKPVATAFIENRCKACAAR